MRGRGERRRELLDVFVDVATPVEISTDYLTQFVGDGDGNPTLLWSLRWILFQPAFVHTRPRAAASPHSLCCVIRARRDFDTTIGGDGPARSYNLANQRKGKRYAAGSAAILAVSGRRRPPNDACGLLGSLACTGFARRRESPAAPERRRCPTGIKNDSARPPPA